ncbi:hypothetical protein [Micromonospora foliorum]|uniref:hypothetical protein n=1 Tax=Micromonospora foliorum TaxID=2911210 RepID=UPI001EE98E68|nr:hypothetical protein [Micromonospora foliorum]MCG5439481.1 hypothetical protein [Micromonospora foliorum]
MARQGWGVSIATAIGVAAGAGAAQLGFGYGLGVITWTPTDAGATGTAWADGLAWATWLAASSTVLGAVCAQRLHQRNVPARAATSPLTATDGARHEGPQLGDQAPEHETPGDGRPPTVARSAASANWSGADAAPPEVPKTPPPVAEPHDRGGLLRRVALALGAGLGGLVTVLLIAVPARVATGADTGAPQRTAAVQAALGILIGVLVAIWALRSRAAAANVAATAAWLWLLAVVSVIDGVRVGRGLTGAQLGTWQFDPDHARYWIGGQLYWPGALLALVPALLIGVLAARRSARSGGHRVGVAASGAAGPVLVALAYLTTLPHWSTLGPAQLSTQLIAPYAVIAGIGGSVLAARLGERADRSHPAERSRSATRSAVARDTVADPTPVAGTDPAPPVSGSAAGPTDPTTGSPAGTTGSPAGTTGTPAPTAGTPAGTTGPTTSTAGTAARRRRTDASPQAPRTVPLPGEATAAPQVPAPRTDPDRTDKSRPAETATAENLAPTSRQTRASRRAVRPTTD